MGKILIDVKDKTKAELERRAKAKKMTIKAFVLAALGLKDE
jgi:hypothetical protein